MARGEHKSPQFQKCGKRQKSKLKTLKMIKNTNEILSKYTF